MKKGIGSRHPKGHEMVYTIEKDLEVGDVKTAYCNRCNGIFECVILNKEEDGSFGIKFTNPDPLPPCPKNKQDIYNLDKELVNA